MELRVKTAACECSALTLPHPGPREFQTPSLGRALVNGCSLSHFLTKFYLLFLNSSTMVLELLFVTAFVLSGKDLFPVQSPRVLRCLPVSQTTASPGLRVGGVCSALTRVAQDSIANNFPRDQRRVRSKTSVSSLGNSLPFHQTPGSEHCTRWNAPSRAPEGPRKAAAVKPLIWLHLYTLWSFCSHFQDSQAPGKQLVSFIKLLEALLPAHTLLP